jgi:2-C-methyl-D-erythritol 4-phosphate cytidylyltransferase/2-C-methyl-D-erythritol 2,4-cyclodiphosphate synthase
MLMRMTAETRAVAIVLAAGAGTRLGADQPKALLAIGGRPLLALAAASAGASRAELVIVAAPPGYEDVVQAHVPEAIVVTGGETRMSSLRAALERVDPGVDVVVVHDAARPFATPALFDDVMQAISGQVAGIVPAVAIADTVKRVDGDHVLATEPRDQLVLAQTPQAFRRSALCEAHERARTTDRSFTDDAAIVEWAGFEVRVVPGDPDNFKITTMRDLAHAQQRLEGSDG